VGWRKEKGQQKKVWCLQKHGQGGGPKGNTWVREEGGRRTMKKKQLRHDQGEGPKGNTWALGREKEKR
jgi:hypothetical protein